MVIVGNSICKLKYLIELKLNVVWLWANIFPLGIKQILPASHGI